MNPADSLAGGEGDDSVSGSQINAGGRANSAVLSEKKLHSIAKTVLKYTTQQLTLDEVLKVLKEALPLQHPSQWAPYCQLYFQMDMDKPRDVGQQQRVESSLSTPSSSVTGSKGKIAQRLSFLGASSELRSSPTVSPAPARVGGADNKLQESGISTSAKANISGASPQALSKAHSSDNFTRNITDTTHGGAGANATTSAGNLTNPASHSGNAVSKSPAAGLPSSLPQAGVRDSMALSGNRQENSPRSKHQDSRMDDAISISTDSDGEPQAALAATTTEQNVNTSNMLRANPDLLQHVQEIFDSRATSASSGPSRLPVSSQASILALHSSRILALQGQHPFQRPPSTLNYLRQPGQAGNNGMPSTSQWQAMQQAQYQASPAQNQLTPQQQYYAQQFRLHALQQLNLQGTQQNSAMQFYAQHEQPSRQRQSGSSPADPYNFETLRAAHVLPTLHLPQGESTQISGRPSQQLTSEARLEAQLAQIRYQQERKDLIRARDEEIKELKRQASMKPQGNVESTSSGPKSVQKARAGTISSTDKVAKTTKPQAIKSRNSQSVPVRYRPIASAEQRIMQAAAASNNPYDSASLHEAHGGNPLVKAGVKAAGPFNKPNLKMNAQKTKQGQADSSSRHRGSLKITDADLKDKHESIVARAVLLAAGKIPQHVLNLDWVKYNKIFPKTIDTAVIQAHDPPAPGQTANHNRLVINKFIVAAMEETRKSAHETRATGKSLPTMQEIETTDQDPSAIVPPLLADTSTEPERLSEITTEAPPKLITTELVGNNVSVGGDGVRAASDVAPITTDAAADALRVVPDQVTSSAAPPFVQPEAGPALGTFNIPSRRDQIQSQEAVKMTGDPGNSNVPEDGHDSTSLSAASGAGLQQSSATKDHGTVNMQASGISEQNSDETSEATVSIASPPQSPARVAGRRLSASASQTKSAGTINPAVINDLDVVDLTMVSSPARDSSAAMDIDENVAMPDVSAENTSDADIGELQASDYFLLPSSSNSSVKAANEEQQRLPSTDMQASPRSVVDVQPTSRSSSDAGAFAEFVLKKTPEPEKLKDYLIPPKYETIPQVLIRARPLPENAYYDPEELDQIYAIASRRDKRLQDLKPKYISKSSRQQLEKPKLKEDALGFPVYRCGYRDCTAELHDFATLVRHCDKKHGHPDNTGTFTCHWGDCHTRKIFFTDLARWQAHMDEEHQQAIRFVCRHRGCKMAFPYEADLELHTASHRPVLAPRSARRSVQTYYPKKKRRRIAESSDEEDESDESDEEGSEEMSSTAEGGMDELDMLARRQEPASQQTSTKPSRITAASLLQPVSWATCWNMLNQVLLHRIRTDAAQTQSASPRKRKDPPTNIVGRQEILIE